MVAARGMFIAIVSTTVETANPIAELNPGINLLGPIVERCAFDSLPCCHHIYSIHTSMPCLLGRKERPMMYLTGWSVFCWCYCVCLWTDLTPSRICVRPWRMARGISASSLAPMTLPGDFLVVERVLR